MKLYCAFLSTLLFAPLVFVPLSFCVPPDQGLDSSGKGKALFQVPFADESPDWEAWRARQNQALETLPVPPAPALNHGENPIDAFMRQWRETNGVEIGDAASDPLFVRRVYLDIAGLLPEPQALRAFLDDPAEDKRERLVDALLNNRQAYAEHWMTFWSDLLRNDEQTNIDDLREPITPWLYESLHENKAYDVMVAELLNPSQGGPRGFLKGINWRGRINASQRPVIQAAQGVGQVFMSTTLKCASCHNHFLKPWKLEDTYGLAAFFSDEPLEIYRCDTLTGEVAHAKFPIEGVGSFDPNAGLIERRESAAELVASPKNERFAKAMTNRLWHKLNGRGLFEPVDDLDATIYYPELLDWLAYDFMKHGYDLKHTLRLILASDTYALASRADAEPEGPPEYANPAPRRMASEQFLDGLAMVTGYAPLPEKRFSVEVNNPVVRTWRHRKPGPLPIALGRPNREQIVSNRDQDASVLQMLELVNGEEFAAWLSHAAEYVMDNNLLFDLYRGQFVDDLFLRAYSREPSQEEKTIAMNMIGQTGMDGKELDRKELSRKEQCERLEDFLWIVVMSPEFQFIH